jgi:hypothetical protein
MGTITPTLFPSASDIYWISVALIFILSSCRLRHSMATGP